MMTKSNLSIIVTIVRSRTSINKVKWADNSVSTIQVLAMCTTAHCCDLSIYIFLRYFLYPTLLLIPICFHKQIYMYIYNIRVLQLSTSIFMLTIIMRNCICVCVCKYEKINGLLSGNSKMKKKKFHMIPFNNYEDGLWTGFQ